MLSTKTRLLCPFKNTLTGTMALHKPPKSSLTGVSIMDLLLPPTSPGIKDPIVDLHGKEEILFMGPDENTADLVDWATEHARARGAPWWKSFFTGKAQRLGGMPHDK